MSAPDRTGVRASPLGVGAMLLAVTGFAFMNLIVKVIPVPALTFGFWRLWLGAALMLIVTTLTHHRPTMAQLRRAAPGGVLFGLNIVFFFSALKRTAIADVQIIAALQPALTLLVAGPLFGERPGRVEVAWVAASVFGVAMVTVGASGSPVWSFEGDLFAVGSLFAFTGYFLVSKRVRRTVPPLEYMTGVTVIAACVVTIPALLTRQPLGSLRPVDWALMAIFVLGAQTGHSLIVWAHGHVDVTVSSLVVLGEPMLAPVIAWVFIDEPLTPLMIAGAVLVFTAMAAVVLRATRRDRSLVEADLPPA